MPRYLPPLGGAALAGYPAFLAEVELSNHPAFVKRHGNVLDVLYPDEPLFLTREEDTAGPIENGARTGVGLPAAA